MKNCLIFSIKFYLNNKGSSLKIEPPIIMESINDLNLNKILKYLNYVKASGYKRRYVFLPHFFVTFNGYEIHTTEKGIIKIEQK